MGFDDNSIIVITIIHVTKIGEKIKIKMYTFIVYY